MGEKERGELRSYLTRPSVKYGHLDKTSLSSNAPSQLKRQRGAVGEGFVQRGRLVGHCSEGCGVG